MLALGSKDGFWHGDVSSTPNQDAPKHVSKIALEARKELIGSELSETVHGSIIETGCWDWYLPSSAAT
jgi:hypothetical protein